MFKPSSDSVKTAFAGFKASKLSSVTQSLFGSDSKKEAAISAISWTSSATATATTTAATATPVPSAELKEEAVVEKVKNKECYHCNVGTGRCQRVILILKCH